MDNFYRPIEMSFCSMNLWCQTHVLMKAVVLKEIFLHLRGLVYCMIKIGEMTT